MLSQIFKIFKNEYPNHQLLVMTRRISPRSKVGKKATLVRTPFSYLRNGWMDLAETWCVARGPLALRFAKNGGYPHERTCNRTHFKHICLLPLVHHQKGVLLVIKVHDNKKSRLHRAKSVSIHHSWSSIPPCPAIPRSPASLPGILSSSH